MILQIISSEGLVRLSINGSLQGLSRPIASLGIKDIPFERVYEAPREVRLAGDRKLIVHAGDTVSLI